MDETMAGRLEPRRIERWLVVSIAAHSLAVGVALLFFTDWSVAFGGWGTATPRFFARQAGIFHVVVALGYLFEYQRYRGVGLLVMAKSIAVLFLVAMTLLGDGATWALPLSAVADGMMAVVVVVVHRWAARQ